MNWLKKSPAIIVGAFFGFMWAWFLFVAFMLRSCA